MTRSDSSSNLGERDGTTATAPSRDGTTATAPSGLAASMQPAA